MTCEITLLTWNVNNGFPRNVSKQGSAKRRDTLIPLVLKHLDKQGPRPHVVLIQESTIQQHTAKTRWRLSVNYQQQQERSGLRQGIDTCTTLDELDMPSLSDQIDSLVPEGATDEACALERADRKAGFADDIMVCDSNDRRLMRSDIPSRAFARKLEVTLNGKKAPVIVVSFHSIYIRKSKERKRYIKFFFNLMCRLAHVQQCPVLIGGDFNLPVGDWRKDIEQRFEDQVSVAEIYLPTPRRSRPGRSRDNIIDTFAVVHPLGHTCPLGGRVTCTLSEPVALYPFPDLEGDSSDHLEVVEFSDSEKKKIKELMPETRRSTRRRTRRRTHRSTHPGTPDWKTLLQYDLDHDPVYVTATLEYESSSDESSSNESSSNESSSNESSSNESSSNESSYD